MTQGERAFGLTVAALVVAVGLSLPFALGAPASPFLLVTFGVPSVLVGLVWGALHRKCSRGGVWPGRVAWLLIGAFVVCCYFLVSFAGFGWLPACALLAHAAVITPAPD